ncbi:MAG TPA: T9SS type A sorting domain-containing protein [Ignavibacteriaceae bacterium]|nr:T9SS type A sorting domain-containing protein [Ignavibacteriaceae bacterium]
MKKNVLFFLILINTSLFSQISWMGNEYTNLSAPQYLGDKIIFEIQSWPIASNQGAQVYIDWYNDDSAPEWFDLPWFKNENNNSYWQNNSVTMKYVGTHNRSYLGWQTGESDFISGDFGTFTVNALVDPSGITAERDGTNTDDQINLTWTVWNSKNVMIVRSTGDYSTAPTQGTVYNVNDACGGGTVIYKGSGTSTASTGLSANTTYFYKLYSVNNDYYSPGATASAGTLPVELTSFSAKQNGNNVTLNWKTATETNNFGFDVEKSADSKNWNKIGFVQGSGNSNAPKDYSYTDKISSLNGKFYYRLKQIDNDGTTSFSKVVEVESLKPATFGLSQNYPNPFNPSTVIRYQIPVDSRVSVKVYNVLGNVVTTLQNGFQTAGEYSVTLDGSNLASGVYFYKIEAGEFTATKKMLLTK